MKKYSFTASVLFFVSVSLTLISVCHAATFSNTFLEGWHLISLPYTPTDTNPTTFFGDSIEEFCAYRNGKFIYRNDMTTEIFSSGWAYFASDTQFVRDGTINNRNPYIYNLQSGWNIVGNPFIGDLDKDYILDDWAVDGTPTTAVEKFYVYGATTGWSEVETIPPWNAAAVKTDSATTMAVFNGYVFLPDKYTRATINWEPTPGAVGYYIYVDGEKINADPATGTTYEIGGLNAAEDHRIQIKPLDAFGNEAALNNEMVSATFSLSGESTGVVGGQVTHGGIASAAAGRVVKGRLMKSLPILGATVELENTLYKTISDNYGYFEMTGIPQGDYTLKATDINNNTVTESVSVVPAQSTQVGPVVIIIPNEWITISPGDFIMGCADADTQCNANESPKHTVTLSGYRIQKYEVTNAQYKKCVDAGVCSAPSSFSSNERISYYGNTTYANYPVIYVNWNQADTYCGWQGGRLPTEAEWEKAARGQSPNENIYPWGDNAPDCSLANYYDNNSSVYCEGDTSPVNAYPFGVSGYGAMNMSGNVWEWVQDWFDENYYAASPAINPQGSSSGGSRVLRGGSWYGLLTSNFRVSCRSGEAGYLAEGVGFRCAWSAPAVTLVNPSNRTPITMDLSWTQTEEPDFVSYEVYLATSAGVTRDSTLVDTISDKTVTSTTVNGLATGTTYYFKVFTCDTVGACQGSNEVSGTTASASFRNISCLFDEGICYIVGYDGIIAKITTDLNDISYLKSGTTETLTGVYCPGTGSICYVTGFNGIILKTGDGGNTWLPQSSGVTSRLNAVYCVNDNICYVSGHYGTILKTINGGISWVSQESDLPDLQNEASNRLYSVNCPVDENHCYIVGNVINEILETSNGGATWAQITYGSFTYGSLHKIACAGNNDICYAVGEFGRIFKTIDGWNTNVMQTSGTSAFIESISCTSNSNVCVSVTQFGGILRTSDGGNVWETVESGTSESLMSISCSDVICLIAGFNGTIIRIDL